MSCVVIQSVALYALRVVISVSTAFSFKTVVLSSHVPFKVVLIVLSCQTFVLPKFDEYTVFFAKSSALPLSFTSTYHSTSSIVTVVVLPAVTLGISSKSSGLTVMFLYVFTPAISWDSA